MFVAFLHSAPMGVGQGCQLACQHPRTQAEDQDNSRHYFQHSMQGIVTAERANRSQYFSKSIQQLHDLKLPEFGDSIPSAGSVIEFLSTLRC